MVPGFLVHRANADVEVESVESSLNTVHTATDSQDRQCIPVVCVCFVLLVAMLMLVGLDCCCDYVCRGWSGHYGKRERVWAQFRTRLAPLRKLDHECRCGICRSTRRRRKGRGTDTH